MARGTAGLSAIAPLLFVDIDGVLNPFDGPCPAGFVEHRLFPQDDESVRVCAAHGDWLHELAGHDELVWATSWTADDRALLNDVLDLPMFSGAASMPPDPPFDPGRTTLGVATLAGDRAAAWIDDIITPEASAWVAARRVPTLLVAAEPAIGLTRSQVDQLIAWAADPR